MATLSDLGPRLKKHSKEIKKQTAIITQAVASDVLQTLVTGTPVDTSQALSNWQVGIGSGVFSPRSAYFLGKFGSTRGASAGQAIKTGEQVIRTHKPGKAIHITNALPYIEGLNDGTISKQPGAFVQKAMLVGQDRVRQSKFNF